MEKETTTDKRQKNFVATLQIQWFNGDTSPALEVKLSHGQIHWQKLDGTWDVTALSVVARIYAQ